MIKELPRAYILAGGRSSRFPGDKALHLIDGVPQLLRLQQQLVQIGHLVSIVADRSDRYADLGIESIPDIDPQAGPLCGLLTALREQVTKAEPSWILIVGCDQLTWREQWSFCSSGLEKLATSDRDEAEQCEAVQGSSIDTSAGLASSLLWQSERFSPIPGYFHTRALPILEKLWDEGRRALFDLANAEELRLGWLPIASEHPRDSSFNTEEQLAQLLRASR